MNRFSRIETATAIAVFFHSIGLFGLLFSGSSFFLNATPLNLLLSFGLLLWTQEEKNTAFYIFLATCVLTGIGVEMIGVNTGSLFGAYEYGDVLGVKVNKVPLLIGVNWFIIIFCSGIAVHTLLSKLISSVAFSSGKAPTSLKALSVIVDGATLAVFFDWLMEPVAIKLGFWNWLGDGSIPFFNYVCWFGVSAALLVVFHFSKFSKSNKFAVNLLLIQLMFFLVLRTFLK